MVPISQSAHRLVLLCADDTATYLAVSSLEDAHIQQQDLDRLHQWELQWDMEFNPSKCIVIHVTMSRTPVPVPIAWSGFGISCRLQVSGRGNQQQPII